jgi:hypothetical protein
LPQDNFIFPIENEIILLFGKKREACFTGKARMIRQVQTMDLPFFWALYERFYPKRWGMMATGIRFVQPRRSGWIDRHFCGSLQPPG